MIRLLVRRIVVRTNVRAKRLYRVRDQCRSITVAAHEFCWWPKGQVQDVVKDQHLPVTVRASADADGRSTYFGGDHGRYLAGDALQVQAGDTSAIKSDCITHELLDARQIFPLYFVTAHHVDRLRGQSDMPGHGNFGV